MSERSSGQVKHLPKEVLAKVLNLSHFSTRNTPSPVPVATINDAQELSGTHRAENQTAGKAGVSSPSRAETVNIYQQ